MSTTTLLLQDPYARIQGKERCSKLLRFDDDLSQAIAEVQRRMRTELDLQWSDRMGLHTELLKRGENKDDVDLQHRRAAVIHGRELDLTRRDAWYLCQNVAFAIDIAKALVEPLTDDERALLPDDVHITVAFLGRTRNADLTPAGVAKMTDLATSVFAL